MPRTNDRDLSLRLISHFLATNSMVTFLGNSVGIDRSRLAHRLPRTRGSFLTSVYLERGYVPRIPNLGMYIIAHRL